MYIWYMLNHPLYRKHVFTVLISFAELQHYYYYKEHAHLWRVTCGLVVKVLGYKLKGP